jgi:hypothetical protein
MGLYELIATAYLIGPAAAITSGLGFMNASQLYVVLFISYTAPLPLVFYLLGYFDCLGKCQNRVRLAFAKINSYQMKASKNSSEWIFRKFNDMWGELGYDLSIMFLSFAFGFLWASVIAYAMRLNKRRAVIFITLGTVLGLNFWFAVTVFSLGFLDPKIITAVLLVFAAVSFVYGNFREKMVLRGIGRMLKNKLKINYRGAK